MASRSLGQLTLDLIAKIGGFTGPLSQAERDLDKRSRRMKKVASDIGQAIGAGITAGVGIAATGLTLYIKNTIEAEKVSAQLAARIKDTGGIAGRSLEQLNEQAERLSNLTVFDDEAIGEAQAALLVFKEVRGLQFDKAIESAADLATVMGTDVPEAAKLLGKALSEPEAGFGALKRAGITFTESQREAIKAMADAGDVAGAQDAILQQLQSTMGTAAEASRNTLGGALQGLQNAFDNLLEGDTGSDGIRGAVDAVNGLRDTLNDPELKRGVGALAEGLLNAANASLQAIGELGNFISQYKKFLADKGFMEGDQIDQLETRRDKLVKFRSTARGELFNLADHSVDREIAKIDSRIAELQRLARWGDVVTGFGTTEVDTPRTPADEKGRKAKGGRGSKGRTTDPAEEYKKWAEKIADAEADLMRQFAKSEEERTRAIEGWAELTAQLSGPLAEAEFDHIKRMQEIQRLGEAAGATADQITAAKAKEVAAYGKVTEAIKQQQEVAANPELVRTMDGLRQVGYDFLVDLPEQGVSAWKNLLDNLERMITQWAAKGIIDQLFGPQGTTGSGSSFGGWIGTFFNWLGSSYGGGMATGGWASPGTLHEVNERGFEMATVGAKSYLLTGDQPVRITPNHMLGGGGGFTQNLNVVVSGRPDRSTPEQIARASGREAARALSRTGRQ